MRLTVSIFHNESFIEKEKKICYSVRGNGLVLNIMNLYIINVFPNVDIINKYTRNSCLMYN